MINLPFFGSKSIGRTFLVESKQGKLSKINREGEDFNDKSEYGGDYNGNSEGNSKGLQHKVYSELQVLGACWAS